MVKKIQFRTTCNGVTDITAQVKKLAAESGIQNGICLLFTTHTTGALTITSFWDPLGHEDIMDELRRLIPTRVDFKHQHDTPEDAAGHVKSSVMGVDISLIVDEGTLILGHSQGIYFLEFDGPRNRECYVKIFGM